jgi:GNAT superfamily N-acetyltransferase
MKNIRLCRASELDELYSIINEAARAYEDVIPDDCCGRPYIPIEELEQEFHRIQFYGWEEDDQLVGVMGFEPIKDVTLIRHTYVLPSHQRRGIAGRLINFLKEKVNTKRTLVGTWADAWWAIEFYEKHGFKLLPDNKLLNVYWDIPDRQVETSIVMEQVQ